MQSDTTIDLPLRDVLRDTIERDPALNQSRIAREIGHGVSSTTLSQWLTGNYPGDNTKIESRVAAWYESYRDRRASGGLPEAPAWVPTPTAERIQSGLRYAQIAGDIVIIYGPAGVSKTKACEQYARTAPAVWHVTMSPATMSVNAALEHIALNTGIRNLLRGGFAMQGQLIARLTSTQGLLIIDEAQHLGYQALDEIRSIHDATGIGIALVGNETVYTRMAGGSRAPYLDRLFSRVGKRIALRAPGDADIDMMIDAWKITDAGCRRQIREIAKRPGALRVLTKIMRLAASYAIAQDKPVCCDDVRAAWRELGVLE